MSRINTNVPSLIAQRILSEQSRGLNASLERLSTGLRINRGADDPAGLIVSEALRAEKAAIGAAIQNAERAEQVLGIAEAGLDEVSTLLIELQSLVGISANDAGLSEDERAANQLQIDSLLQAIDRIANVTTFNGEKLLSGNYDYTTSVDAADVGELEGIQVNSARIPAGASLDVGVEVLAAAETGAVYLSTTATLDNGDNGPITIEISGSRGVQQFTFASGTAQDDIISAINTFSDAIGVEAAVATVDTDKVALTTVGYGSEEFVRARILAGTTDPLLADADTLADGTATDLTDFGVDILAAINGQAATGRGLQAHVVSDGFDVVLDIAAAGGLNAVGEDAVFSITGGGANFNLTPDVSLSGRLSIGIGAVTSGSLGSTQDGSLSLLKTGGAASLTGGDLARSQRIVDAAITDVARLRGRIGAVAKNNVGSAIRSLGIAFENTAAAEARIRDTDFAFETAELARRQILVQAATAALTIANAQPQTVLQLLAG